MTSIVYRIDRRVHPCLGHCLEASAPGRSSLLYSSMARLYAARYYPSLPLRRASLVVRVWHFCFYHNIGEQVDTVIK
eukprot:COSAG01_NODE_3730_length_5755_cov_8.305870_1_plen_77_part_00